MDGHTKTMAAGGDSALAWRLHNLEFVVVIAVAPRGIAERARGLPMPGKHAAIALAVVIGQIALGGWVSSNYAALACHDFPSCDGSYTPVIDLAEGFNLFRESAQAT